MTNLILHIGRHKTGTTAIQDCLIRNETLLRSQGYYYPHNARKGRGHHRISEANAGIKGSIKGLFIKPRLPEHLLTEMRENSSLTAIISSEAFQNCSPSLIKTLFENFTPRIIVYLRNHVDYIASAYTQKVHATGYCGSIEQYYLTSYSVNYLRFLRKWEQKFPENMIVRKFEPTTLVGNDVVSDFFFHALNIHPEMLVEPTASNSNPSLNRKVLQFKLHLNRTGEYKQFSGRQLYNGLPKLNDEFPDDKVRTPALISKLAIKINKKRDSLVARKYFMEDTLFEYQRHPARPNYRLTRSEIAKMKSRLLEITK